MASHDSDGDYFDGREEDDSDDSDDENFEPEVESEHSDIENSDDDASVEHLEVQMSTNNSHLFLSKDKKIRYSADPLPYARPPVSVSGIISNEGNILSKTVINAYKHYKFCYL